MIVRIIKAVLCILLTVVLCGCSMEESNPTSVVHHDPVSEYETLAAANNVQGISTLIRHLAAAEDYTNSAAIVNAEAATFRYPIDFPKLSVMFAGREGTIDLQAWTPCYLAYSKSHTSEWEQELQLLSSYNTIIRSYYQDDWAAFKYVLQNANREFTDMGGAQLSQCGSVPNGKVLIYFPHGEFGSWLLSASAALPSKRIPTSLDEVEYVILIEETRTPVGTYTNGGKAKRRDYTISLIHCPDGEVICMSQPVEGGNPPRAINENQPGGIGEPPEPGNVASELVMALSWIDRTE